MGGILIMGNDSEMGGLTPLCGLWISASFIILIKKLPLEIIVFLRFTFCKFIFAI